MGTEHEAALGRWGEGFPSFRQLLKCFHLISHSTHGSVKQLAPGLMCGDV